MNMQESFSKCVTRSIFFLYVGKIERRDALVCLNHLLDQMSSFNSIQLARHISNGHFNSKNDTDTLYLALKVLQLAKRIMHLFGE